VQAKDQHEAALYFRSLQLPDRESEVLATFLFLATQNGDVADARLHAFLLEHKQLSSVRTSLPLSYSSLSPRARARGSTRSC
jgi:hypothetical protein